MHNNLQSLDYTTTVMQGQRWQRPSTSSSIKSQQQNNVATEHAIAEVETLGISLRLDSAKQVPAAEAVIAALYGVQDCFVNLQHEQLLQAIVKADMIDLPEIADRVLELLHTAAKSDKGLIAAALRSLTSLSAWLVCMYQLLPTALNKAATWPAAAETEGSASATVGTDLKSVAAATKMALFSASC